MPDDATPDINPDEIKKNIDTLARLGLTANDLLNVTPQDILYLVKRMQFLQIVESTGAKKPTEEPEFLTAPSGWTIHHYGDAMCTSPGKLLFSNGYFPFHTKDDDEGGESGTLLNPGKGTMIKQAFDSAFEMVRLAKEFGWGGILIVDGHPDMQRAAWIEAVRIGIRLEGYYPDIEAEKKRRRIVSPSIPRMKEVLAMLGKKG